MRARLRLASALLLWAAVLLPARGDEGPALVSDVATDKLLYYPRETVFARFGVRNVSGEARSLQVVVESVRDLDDRKTRLDEAITLPAGETKPYVVEVPAADFRLGSAVAVTLRKGGRPVSRKQAIFQVSDRLGEAGIGASASGWSQTGLKGKAGEVLAIPDEARRRGVNTLELFFWSPCDWALHVPRTDRWWSGQASYPEDRAVLAELIRRAHAHGIRVLMYASCNPAGPYGWEAAYRHPEWFHDGNGLLPALEPAQVEALDNWNNPDWRAAHPAHPGWLRVPVDLRIAEALDYGIRALLDGAKAFDWDGVRFDGHYTISGFDELSTHNLRRLKEAIANERPGFELGYNYGRAPEWRNGYTHELREAMAGGGLYLQEGIRAWWKDNTKYTSWSDYATNELRVAKRLQSLGGFCYCMWEGSRLPPEQAFYQFVYGLIAGGHPALFLDNTPPHCSDWGAFLTRWSRFLWDRNLRAAEAGDRLSVVPEGRLFWRPLMQELVDSPSRRFLVVHLVSPPPDDAIERTAFPPPAGDVTLSYRLAAGESLVRAALVSPQREPFDARLEPETSGATVRFRVPDVPLWAMVVLELKGAFTSPTPAPEFTEPPDPGDVEKARRSALTARIGDPNKEAETVGTNSNSRIWETDGGMSGIGAKPGADPEAANGRCQVNDYTNVRRGHSQKFMGYSYLGPLRPGRYRVRYRMKWTESAGGAGWKVFFYVNDNSIDQDVVRATLVSPSKTDANAVERPQGGLLGPPGAFRNYDFEFVKAEPGYISACAMVDTAVEGDQRILLDHVRTDLLALIPDRELVKLPSPEKKGVPAANAMDLADQLLEEEADADALKTATARVPNGQKPGKFLLVKGLLADLYRVAEVANADTAYALPTNAAGIFPYDCVTLANVDLTFSTLAQRKLLKDFVEAGGRLVVLGGIATLGNGGMPGTFLEDLLPVQMAAAGEVRRCEPPLVLGDAPGRPFADQPALFWRHGVSPKPAAQPLAYAGAEPIAFSAPFGKGRVFLFAGTVLGPGPRLERPFWQTDSWAALLRRLLAAP